MDIRKASEMEDIHLKTLARHFKRNHGSDPKKLRVKGIDAVTIGKRGGDWKKVLAQIENKLCLSSIDTWCCNLNPVTKDSSVDLKKQEKS